MPSRSDNTSIETSGPALRSGPSQGIVSRARGAAIRLLDAGSNGAVSDSDLVATLNEVASAVSSAMSVEAVLDVIVDRAKSVSDTDKALLVLADQHGEELDFDTLVVRGSRSQHSQDWWESRLSVLGERVFETGLPVIERHPEENALLLASPILVRDHPIGLLGAINSGERPFTRQQTDFLSVLSAFAASAIDNAQLAEQNRYVLLASERDRIAREMHDGVVQSLFAVSLGLELCKKQILRDPVAVSTRLEELQERLNMSMTELRRFIYDLRPMKLAELGLVGAVEFWAADVTQGKDMHCSVAVDGTMPRMSPSEEACLYRVTKEAVSNAVRHSNAKLVEVRIGFNDAKATVEVSDDGDGFDVGTAMSADCQGMGLRSIRDRMRAECGALDVVSNESGTSIVVSIPIGGTR